LITSLRRFVIFHVCLSQCSVLDNQWLGWTAKRQLRLHDDRCCSFCESSVLQEGLHRDNFTFIVNHQPFPNSWLRQYCYRRPFVNNCKSRLAQAGVAFVILKLTQLTLLPFKVSFLELKLFFKSRIRNRSFYSAGN
jgi:hypothetical protein